MADPFDLLFELSPTQFRSGEALARARGVSRMAIWKAVQRLQALGVEIDSVRGRGYRLRTAVELLSKEPIEAAMGDGEAVLDEVHVLSSVDSTNADLLRRFSCADSQRAAVFAEYQSAGRGRRGRAWESPFGAHIYVSLRWQFHLPAASLSLLSLAAASELAVLLEEEGLNGHGIKWPNDLLWQGRKLGGLLLELAGEQHGPCAVVIGLGINWKMPEAAARRIDQPWADLTTAMAGRSVSRNLMAGRLLSALINACAKYEALGFGPFKDQWCRFDLIQGQLVDVYLSQERRSGRAVGIDAHGRLEVDVDGCIEHFSSGEVSVRATS